MLPAKMRMSSLNVIRSTCKNTWFMMKIFGIFCLSFLWLRNTTTTVALAIIPTQAIVLWIIVLTGKIESSSLFDEVLSDLLQLKLIGEIFSPIGSWQFILTITRRRLGFNVRSLKLVIVHQRLMMVLKCKAAWSVFM